MSRMLTYVEDRIIKKVSIALHFDDNTIIRSEMEVGDEIAITYLFKRNLVELQGVIRDIFVNRFDQTTLKLDISSKYRSGIIFIVTDNIRGFLDIVPGEPHEGIISGETRPPHHHHGGVVGDGTIDTFEEVVQQLTWQE